MLSTDELLSIRTRLAADASLLRAVIEGLTRLRALPAYEAWHAGAAQAQPFVAEAPAAPDFSSLAQAGLVSQGRLQVRLNRHAGRLFLTDGVWVPSHIRVFPYCDESQVLVEHVAKHSLLKGVDQVVDLAGGCGHTAWALESKHRVTLDINPRALAYAELNKLLNGLQHTSSLAALNDIRNGIPRALRASARTLVVGNMPFGPAPFPEALPLTSNGGLGGIDLQIAALLALRDWQQQLPLGASVSALLLGLSVGDAARNRWAMLEQATRIFDSRKVRWVSLPHELLLRANGERFGVNPAPVREALPALALCQLYTPNAADRKRNEAGYRELAEQHVRQGNPDLAYGMLQLELG